MGRTMEAIKDTVVMEVTEDTDMEDMVMGMDTDII